MLKISLFRKSKSQLQTRIFRPPIFRAFNISRSVSFILKVFIIFLNVQKIFEILNLAASKISDRNVKSRLYSYKYRPVPTARGERLWCPKCDSIFSEKKIGMGQLFKCIKVQVYSGNLTPGTHFNTPGFFQLKRIIIVFGTIIYDILKQ